MKDALILVLLILSMHTKAQTVIELYHGHIPNNIACNQKEFEPLSGRVTGITVPTITAYLPAHRDSFASAVLIFPGGGYTRLAIEHEGYEVAKAFNRYGIAAFVVKNRLPNDSCMVNKTIVPLQDAEQAMKIVRERAAEWGINRIGIIGFSAGGHLASSLGTKFNEVVIENSNNTVLRPDFMILGYPVISMMDSLTHKGSKQNLLGNNPSPEQRISFSTDLQVTPQTPPTFIVHAADDKTVSIQNSMEFYKALLKNKVLAEAHFYEKGGHGFGLHNATTKDDWFESCINWMKANGWVKGDAQQ